MEREERRGGDGSEGEMESLEMEERRRMNEEARGAKAPNVSRRKELRGGGRG